MTISTDTILYETRNNIAYITLNRPESLNAISRELGRGLREALDLFKDDPDLYVAILIGSGGRAFSAGMDLKERAALDAAGDRPESQIRRPLVSSYADRGVFKPVIAAIDGYCVAGGLEMSLSCDIRVATRQSQFGLPEARWSIFPGHAVHNLSRMIPLGEALNMMLTGTRIDSQRAYDIGLIQHLVEDRDELLKKCDEIAEEIKLCAPLAVQGIKRIVYGGKDVPVEHSVRLGAPIMEHVQSTEDAIEGPKAFSEKRRPVWKSA